MTDHMDAGQAIGATAYGSDGEKIGKVGEVYLDDQSGAPEFYTVNTGLFGTSESFVPARGATFDGDRVTLSYTKAVIKDAPKVDLNAGHLDQDEEDRLYAYYERGDQDVSRDYASDRSTSDRSASGDMTTAPAGHDTSGPSTDDAMTRSEEHLVAGTQTREAGRARLRKYVTTETESVSVPVRKERAVIESEPVTASNVNQAEGGPVISEEEHEVVLSEERAVADTVAEPVERVRLGTETYTEQETVSGEVRKENIDVEGDVDGHVDGRSDR
jgi:uncharacterized protein (TIGR02271 family)